MRWLRKRRFNWLAYYINKAKYSTGVEVGAAVGITTGHLLKYCPLLKKLIVVDLWEAVEGSSLFDRQDMEEVFRKTFGKDPRITILKGLSWEMASRVEDKTLDFAFIDASHDYDSVLKDITAWLPKVRTGGLFCGHDIHFPGVVKAVKEVFGTKAKKVGIDNMWFVKI